MIQIYKRDIKTGHRIQIHSCATEAEARDFCAQKKLRDSGQNIFEYAINADPHGIKILAIARATQADGTESAWFTFSDGMHGQIPSKQLHMLIIAQAKINCTPGTAPAIERASKDEVCYDMADATRLYMLHEHINEARAAKGLRPVDEHFPLEKYPLYPLLNFPFIGGWDCD